MSDSDGFPSTAEVIHQLLLAPELDDAPSWFDKKWSTSRWAVRQVAAALGHDLEPGFSWPLDDAAASPSARAASEALDYLLVRLRDGQAIAGLVASDWQVEVISPAAWRASEGQGGPSLGDDVPIVVRRLTLRDVVRHIEYLRRWDHRAATDLREWSTSDVVRETYVEQVGAASLAPCSPSVDDDWIELR